MVIGSKRRRERPKQPRKPFRLECLKCSNTRRFIEVMAEEAHLVDGEMNYVELVAWEVDHYVCGECCAEVPFPRGFRNVLL